jgi:hypothetical protein
MEITKKKLNEKVCIDIDVLINIYQLDCGMNITIYLIWSILMLWLNKRIWTVLQKLG